MIISRAPYRVSFFGGGTDYPEWFEQHGGAFLSTAIDHHVTIVLRPKPALDRYRYRVVWRELEDVEAISAIKHPFVRAALQGQNIKSGMDVVYFGDLPHGAGLGSSSTFGVAFLNALNALENKELSNYDLAKSVYNIEHDVLQETVGIQDQFAAAFGGFNMGRISKNGDVSLERISLPGERLKALSDRLIFIFTGVSRHASAVAATKVKNFSSQEQSLTRMGEMAYEARDILVEDQPLDAFGELLHESWLLKRGLSSEVSPKPVDDLYERARAAGALGGKLLGAGGGGFMAIFVKEGEKNKVERALKDYVQVPVQLDAPGPQIVLNMPPEYSRSYEQVWQKSTFNGVGPGFGK
jgi:D-glycero-alpha-D-manno-heptose-7-phosphate kinase